MNGSLALHFSPIFVKHLAAPGWHLQPFPCFEQSGTLAWLSRGDPPAPGPQGPGRAAFIPLLAPTTSTLAYSVPAALTSLLFLGPTKLMPASGLLHLLFPLTILSPMSTQLRCHSLEVVFDHPCEAVPTLSPFYHISSLYCFVFFF